MLLNIDRLHNVIEGINVGRGCGKTTATLCQILGFIDVGYKEIICIIPSVSYEYYINKDFKKLCELYNLDYTKFKYSMDYMIGDASVKFIPTYEYSEVETFHTRKILVIDLDTFNYGE